MNLEDISSFEGKHAFLGASKYHWLNYDTEKLIFTYKKFLATQRGTELHEFASQCISLNVQLPKSKKLIEAMVCLSLKHSVPLTKVQAETIRGYVNDSVGLGMKSEQLLYYSENCFGTTDAIIFHDGTLQIHDLKTGENPTSIKQLMIYAALYCLINGVDPYQIQIELRIYQNGEINISNPSPDDICMIMNKIVEFDKVISEVKESDLNG